MEYPKDLKPWNLEPHYSRHTAALTTEGLHSKADIAAQLAYRDWQIAKLKDVVDAAMEFDEGGSFGDLTAACARFRTATMGLSR